LYFILFVSEYSAFCISCNFQSILSISAFRPVLTTLFFHSVPNLSKLTKEYAKKGREFSVVLRAEEEEEVKSRSRFKVQSMTSQA
jgi:hypothetical protein